jgi:hypothetical protein
MTAGFHGGQGPCTYLWSNLTPFDTGSVAFLDSTTSQTQRIRATGVPDGEYGGGTAMLTVTDSLANTSSLYVEFSWYHTI